MSTWNLRKGETIRRKDLHKLYGGGVQGGISPSRTSPNVLIFSDPQTGLEHGYHDRWIGSVFLYVGEGQQGSQTFARGNKAIRDHASDGRAIRVFEGCRGEVTYVGEFVLDPDLPWTFERAPSTGGGPQRDVIVFRLREVPSS